MNPFRAKRIADNLSGIGSFRVNHHLSRLQVSYHGQQASFECETAFWAFIFRLAQAGHEESVVAEVEVRLQA